ncbi:hypothetical protein GPY51_18000 [Photorhabdus laumondii subsp. laumondii]|uniref:Photorhabdus luminescens subsp. laumondii TTO1 complete genome segment 15/17 n=2 Tax=Photorhabdus laumondii subsp. laumondii TaxID=141679 RepID=Q7MZ62_PHOLL|nr:MULTISPECIES: insecticidal delta-endotoxin Cry8Ea1 family protein [Photorhabdus]AWK43973.1 hypothetical protein A4R40_21975 [Photorhabdus laumondii subsp. laumondii]AXG44652.1 hypothetical protein PluDJC_21955 [Photorhabdus laumondii subsp. laumondii]AXG49288.1 hypothetical protein PluTT01m_22665 [Photorhabdus laumondii subsp. laumondii]KTL62450.1 hypothetical protein AA106_20410 [Photorhabdus laumondii subsp. laumondii]MCC8386338.1 hypothetical protein [Photorhabdus laumondii]
MSDIVKYNDVSAPIPYAVYSNAVYAFEWDSSAILKQAVVKGLSYVPHVGKYLSYIVGFFWKDKEKDIWQEVVGKVQQLVEDSILKAVKGILSGNINELKEKMNEVIRSLEKNLGTQEARDDYMHLARSMVGKEASLIFHENKTNFHILPMYSTLALMQIMYWTVGIERRKEIGLSDIEVENLRSYIKKLVSDAEHHVNRVYKLELDSVVSDSDVNRVADNIMYVHGYCQIHGLEYMDIIKNIQSRGNNITGFYPRTISYSTFFGSPTSDARILALRPEKDMPEPFKPKFLNERFNKIASVKGYIVRIGGAKRVGGLEITFENGSKYQQGQATNEHEIVNLKGNLIKTLEVWGNGAIDEAKFTLTNGDVLTIGQRNSSNYRKFSLDGHYICGVFIANDRSGLAGQAANIAVSYHQLVE